MTNDKRVWWYHARYHARMLPYHARYCVVLLLLVLLCCYARYHARMFPSQLRQTVTTDPPLKIA